MNRGTMLAAAALLALQAVLTVWGVTRNSVTFDETAHVASGVAYVRYGNTWISAVNPPLVKIGYGAAALAAGAHLPEGNALHGRDQFVAAEALMRANGTRYHGIVSAARLVNVVLALALSLLVWLAARALYGEAAGLFALALSALCPELLAHGGLATLDVATALFSFACVLALIGLVRSGSWRWAAFLAAAFAALTLTRFTSWLVWGVLAALTVAALLTRMARHPRRLVITTIALVPLALLALHVGYRGETSLHPLREGNWSSNRFQELARRAPGLVIPLPDAYLAGIDHQMYESQSGITPTYFRERISRSAIWYYTPVALAVKWPLALWASLLLAAILWLRPRRIQKPGPWFEPAALATLPVLLLLASMFLVQLNVGVRYLLPALPALFVFAGSILAPAVKLRGIRIVAIVLALGAAVEAGTTAPWFLSFFNAAGGGPGNGDRIVNDSNVDVGQGLIALREEMARLGIQRIHLAYHGTVDPAFYGIDYVPYMGGEVGPESDWLAVSSYYFVGLSQRMMTSQGRTPFIEYRFESIWARPPAARPAHCMYLFRMRAK